MPEAKNYSTDICVSVSPSVWAGKYNSAVHKAIHSQPSTQTRTNLLPPSRQSVPLLTDLHSNPPNLKTHLPTVSMYINYKDNSSLIYLRDRSGPAGVFIMNWPLYPVFSPYLIELSASLAAAYDFTQVLKPLIAGVVLFRVPKD